MSTRFEAPRGTHDILPAEQPLWRYVISTFERLCDRYGYRRIDTPVFEDTDLFVRTSGIGSDVVTKEMYTFTDRGERSLTLRAEATAPIVRAYLEHGLHREPQPVKLYAIETIYRYGRPQKGRYREHWQLDLEAIGSDDPAVDAEVIQLYDTLLTTLGVSDYRLELNSIGDGECRPAYLDRLVPWLAEHASELDEQTRDQAGRNPLRALDNIAAKPPAVRELLRQAPTIGDSLCDACRRHFAEVRRYLDAFGVRYQLVPTLVRGLDYYTRTTWEFVGPEGGSQSTLSGGGRYDGLAEELGGHPTPGVGFGAGIERLLLAVEQAGTVVPAAAPVDVFFVCEEGADRAAVLAAMMELRRDGLRCEADYAGRSRKGQLTQARRLRAARVVVVDSGTDVAAALEELRATRARPGAAT
ncbi:MAG TPA: histidine--tRNA ligase [Gaiellaceae bacterium]|nr:histidine--tRNA ligase [Gaiellaceae bacterium]